MLFSANAILFLLIMELHYTAWSAKPVLPILFFALALYGRYLPNKYNRTSSITNERDNLNVSKIQLQS
jgi:hypothetical protein